jgi:hypothetical protein
MLRFDVRELADLSIMSERSYFAWRRPLWRPRILKHADAHSDEQRGVCGSWNQQLNDAGGTLMRKTVPNRAGRYCSDLMRQTA